MIFGLTGILSELICSMGSIICLVKSGFAGIHGETQKAMMWALWAIALILISAL